MSLVNVTVAGAGACSAAGCAEKRTAPPRMRNAVRRRRPHVWDIWHLLPKIATRSVARAPGGRARQFYGRGSELGSRSRIAAMKHRLTLVVTVTSVIAATSAPFAQEKVDADIQWKIRREATQNSQILRTLHFLTDVHGPRLTGSPNLKAAQEWVIRETTRWGLRNAHLEPWNFGHPGSVNEKLSVHVISPIKDSLITEALAWTPGTNGTVTAQVAKLVVPSQPTKAVLTKFFDDHRAA